ncbi:AbrB/MazE/SpoVT family DNA-binding domain-containing protein [Desulfoscipio gibsoniae]|uniref:Looped-hinge helix DNA binding domain, AbrB family n=1 Tax=Desulfoscipio gibsoniae DSM 7213 TaxID=767817 RepID=R4KMC2_9FIRM|nr:AbrB/MazE/SpoVT family DNA-binding domain-containing protein [Desulfoscipio gibsoniae]AGL01680.1 hypothetical protein Desgi_2254 [Desulfoscipio gibsoniae DSM 7213]
MSMEHPQNELRDKESVVREKFQVTLPAFIRDRARLNVGDILLWEFDENSKTMTVIKRPFNFTSQLSGLGKHLWKNGVETLKKERAREWGV